MCGVHFFLRWSFNRTQDTKRFTVPFTRFGRDNKSVSVCVPAIVYACAHMPVCVSVCLCVCVCNHCRANVPARQQSIYEALQLVSSVWTLSRSLTLSLANK